MSPLTVLLIAFLVLLLINTPIAFVIGGSGIVWFLAKGTMPISIAIQRVVAQTQSITFLAVPFFIFAGNLMNRTGITPRLMKFSQLVTRRMVGGTCQVSVVLSTLMGGVSGSAGQLNPADPYDPEHLLNHFFLNSRGAIARFDRGAIEIRLVDIQECPNADIAIVEMEVATLKAIASGKLANKNAPHTMNEYREFLRDFDTERLASLLTATTRDAENTVIEWPEFLAVFGMSGKCTAGDIWKHVFDAVKGDLTEVSYNVMEQMLARGTLSSALYRALGDAPSHEKFVTEYKKLADCLAHNRLYGI